jgi:osmotically-inducible protein OsmY
LQFVHIDMVDPHHVYVNPIEGIQERNAMKRLSLSLISFAAAGALAMSPMSARATTLGQTAHTTAHSSAVTTKQSAPVSDRTLTDRIEKRLESDATLKKYDFDVSVDHGVATLTGKVRTEAEKTKAGVDAKIAGITRVDNQITLDKDAGKSVSTRVKEGTNTAGNKTRSATDTAVDKTKDATNTAIDKTKESVNKTGEVVSDSWITTKVHAAFMGEDLLKGSDINVDTTDHVVTLKGTVKSEAAKARAVELAKSRDGVKRVVDDLKVASK